MTPLTEKLKRELEFDVAATTERAAVYAKKRADMLYAGEAKKRSPFDVMRGSYRHGAQNENARLRPILDQLIECVAALEPARNWQADDEPMKSLLLKAQQALTQLEKVLDE